MLPHNTADYRARRAAADAPALGPAQPTGGLELRFKLSEDTEVRSAFRGRVTQEAIRKFIQLLEVSLDTFPARAALPLPPPPGE